MTNFLNRSGIGSINRIRFWKRKTTLFFCCYFFFVFINHFRDRGEPTDEPINIVATICGEENYVEMFFTMLKSALLFQKTAPLHFILLCEDQLQNRVSKTLDEWLRILNNRFTYEIRNVTHREIERGYYKCTMDRLYLPELLPNFNRVLYVDVDAIFLNDLGAIWQQFNFMNSTQLCGAAWNNPTAETSLYMQHQHVPFYGLGLNAGILFMDLKKMREFNWTEHAKAVIEEYRSRLNLLDQDVMNIIFHNNPDKVYLLPCQYNLQSCYFDTFKDICKGAVLRGPAILHGCGYVFQVPAPKDDHDDYIAMYRVYESFKNYEFGTDPLENLVKPMETNMMKTYNNTGTRIMRLYLANANISPS